MRDFSNEPTEALARYFVGVRWLPSLLARLQKNRRAPSMTQSVDSIGGKARSTLPQSTGAKEDGRQHGLDTIPRHTTAPNLEVEAGCTPGSVFAIRTQATRKWRGDDGAKAEAKQVSTARATPRAFRATTLLCGLWACIDLSQSREPHAFKHTAFPLPFPLKAALVAGGGFQFV